MMNQQRLDEIRKRCEAATKQSWVAAGGSVLAGEYIFCDGSAYVPEGMLPADAQFIANARQDVPDLVAEIERLRELVPPSTGTRFYFSSEPADPPLPLPPPGKGWDNLSLNFEQRKLVRVDPGVELHRRCDSCGADLTILVTTHVLDLWTQTPPTKPGAYFVRVRGGLGIRPWIGALGMSGSWFMIDPPLRSDAYPEREFWPTPITPPEVAP